MHSFARLVYQKCPNRTLRRRLIAVVIKKQVRPVRCFRRGRDANCPFTLIGSEVSDRLETAEGSQDEAKPSSVSGNQTPPNDSNGES